VLTSTSGKKLALTVGATGDAKGSTVTIGLSQGKESHLWSFKARAADLKVGSTGAGTLTLSSTQTGSRGKLNLKFSPVEAFRTKTCGGQVASKSRKMAVSGIAYFKTGTQAWGNVGRSTRAIKLAGANTVTWTYDVTCPTPASTPACSKVTTWSAFASTGSRMTSISGSSNGTSASVTAFRSVTLTPAGASRVDLVTRSVPVPAFDQSGSSATLVATSGTSSLTVDGDGGFGSDYPCRSGSSTVTGHDTSFRQRDQRLPGLPGACADPRRVRRAERLDRHHRPVDLLSRALPGESDPEPQRSQERYVRGCGERGSG